MPHIPVLCIVFTLQSTVAVLGGGLANTGIASTGIQDLMVGGSFINIPHRVRHTGKLE